MELHEAIRQGREKAGYSQKSIADAIRVDVSTYAHYETGRRSPDADKLEILRMIIDIPAEFIPPSKVPAQRTTVYPEPLLDNLEDAIRRMGEMTDDSYYLRHKLDALEDALRPIMEIRNKTLSTEGLGYELPSGTTILNVNLDKRAEDLISECHNKQIELIDYWTKNAQI